MTNYPNPILPLTALLRPQMPSVYLRQMIYDPTWNNALYGTYSGVRVVPAVGSIVKDSDSTPLWVTAVDPVTRVPTYEGIPLGDSSNPNSPVSVINTSNAAMRVYIDRRSTPNPAYPDQRCIFEGASPRSYTITRYPNTANATLVSQYFDSTGTLQGNNIPLTALTDDNTSWYMQPCKLSATVADNEELLISVYNEDGLEVYSVMMTAKTSAVVNEELAYRPAIVGMTVSGSQRLANGTFFLYQKQDPASLNLQVTLVYSDGSTQVIPVDQAKCVLYGADDLLTSFVGLTQNLFITYYRSANEVISGTTAGATSELISIDVPVVVVSNKMATSIKLVMLPIWNASTGVYMIRYFMYSADGSPVRDVTGYVSIQSGSLNTTSPYYGVQQTCVVSMDMSKVLPQTYATPTTYSQNFVVTFHAPSTLVRWTIQDAATSPYVYGQDQSNCRRPVLKYDATRQQYFVPSTTFINQQAFLNSFYYQNTPPYDPSISQSRPVPTHFVLRDALSSKILVASPIPIASYANAFNILNDTVGNYDNTTVVFEFLNVVSSTSTLVIIGGAVDVSPGTYVGT